ncbi:hypothetical protein FACS189483_08350 [Spirochaetia bacterium]|nr:hypothetical protein FACS189483_08350 [Spirochaetia bacterium]
MPQFSFPDDFIHHFPNISCHNSKPTSPVKNEYNCIAWAYGVDDIWFWPDPDKQYYWPDTISRNEDIATFIELFKSIRYVVCENSNLEYGYQKIAIYIRDGVPTHAARQLPDGKWTSKLGPNIDIEHDTLDCLDGPAYGKSGVIMKRPIGF